MEEWLVSATMAMYDGALTVVMPLDGESNSSKVKVRLHQGSVLSPLLFIILVMDVRDPKKKLEVPKPISKAQYRAKADVMKS